MLPSFHQRIHVLSGKGSISGFEGKFCILKYVNPGIYILRICIYILGLVITGTQDMAGLVRGLILILKLCIWHRVVNIDI